MFALVLFTGCFLVVDEDTYPAQYASVACARTRECDRGLFESEYDDDMGECTDDVEDYFDDLVKGFDKLGSDCDFDEDEARGCLEDMQSSTCGDLYEEAPKDCSQVYSCLNF